MDRLTDVSDIVDASRNIDGYEKDLLKKLFEKLELNQISMYEQIEEKISKQLHSPERCWHIYTAFIENDDYTIEQAKGNGFHEIVPVDSNHNKMKFSEFNTYTDDDLNVFKRGNVYAGTMFLKCKYSELIDFKKDYSGVVYTDTGEKYCDVTYNLMPYHALMEEEKKLEQTALQYNIDVPIIYSPMSRRAVVVKVNIDVKNVREHRNYSIDFQYDKNGLDKNIYLNKTLVWNVSSEGKDVLPRPRENSEKKITAQFDKNFVIYSFYAGENDYYYVRSDNHDIRRIDDSVYLGIDSRTQIEYIEYQKFTIENINKSYIENIMSFENKYNPDYCLKKRVRTKGDIHNILSCFGISYDGIYFKPKYEAVCTYGKDYKYHYPTDNVLISSSVVYIKLSDNTDDIFFEDYVNYVFAYLNYYYPEFRWVGVK